MESEAKGGGLNLPGRGRGGGTVILSGPAKLKYSNIIFVARPKAKMLRGVPYSRNGRFAAGGRFIQCKFGKTDREGGSCSYFPLTIGMLLTL